MTPEQAIDSVLTVARVPPGVSPVIRHEPFGLAIRVRLKWTVDLDGVPTSIRRHYVVSRDGTIAELEASSG